MLNYFLQSLKTSVVHVGRGEFYVSQCRCLELAAIQRIQSGQESTWVGLKMKIKSVVVKQTIGHLHVTESMAMETICAK